MRYLVIIVISLMIILGFFHLTDSNDHKVSITEHQTNLVNSAVQPLDIERSSTDVSSPTNNLATPTLLPKRVRFLDSTHTHNNYLSRLKAVHTLPSVLSKDEVAALYSFMESKNNTYPNMSRGELNALKNDVLVHLIKLDSMPADLGKKMVEMYRDKDIEEGWRSYCVQFIPHFCGRLLSDRPRDENTDETISEMINVLWTATDEIDNMISGVALVALESMATSDSKVELSDVLHKAAIVTLDESSSLESRLTAIQVCAKNGKRDILPMARKIAESDEILPVRMSSIFAVGMLGTAEDKGLLESLASDSDANISKAAKKALSRVCTRLNSGDEEPSEN